MKWLPIDPGLTSFTFMKRIMIMLAATAAVAIMSQGCGKKEEPAPKEVVWIDDGTPAGAKPDDPWDFVGKPDHPVFSGETSHTQTAQGLQQHFFTGAQKPLVVGPGDRPVTRT